MNVLSLFDGMSCGRIALERAGIKVDNYYASEIDKFATQVSEANYPEIHRMGDVTEWWNWDIDWSTIDLVIAGSPCQGFSFAGKQLAFDDPRSKLFFVFVEILETIQKENPNVKFLLENVGMKKEYQQVITDTLGVEPTMINSALVSAQNRNRIYWANWYFPQPGDVRIMLEDIVEDSPEAPTVMSDKFCKRNAHILRDDISGKSKSLSAMEYVKNGRQGDYIRCGAMRGRYIVDGKRQDGKMLVAGLTKQRIEVRYDGKTNSLTTVAKDNHVTYGADGSKNFALEDIEYRKLTPIECERLQTVPDNYTNHVSNSQRYKMLGNGWTVDVIAHIFDHMEYSDCF